MGRELLKENLLFLHTMRQCELIIKYVLVGLLSFSFSISFVSFALLLIFFNYYFVYLFVLESICTGPCWRN